MIVRWGLVTQFKSNTFLNLRIAQLQSLGQEPADLGSVCWPTYKDHGPAQVKVIQDKPPLQTWTLIQQVSVGPDINPLTPSKSEDSRSSDQN